MKGILIDRESGDLIVEHGALAIGDTEGQTVEAVVLTTRGEWKDNPLLGGEAQTHLGGERDPFWPGRLKKMLKACGVELESVSVDDKGTITIS